MDMVVREWVDRLRMQSETLSNAKQAEDISYEIKQRDALYRKFNYLPKIIKTEIGYRLPYLDPNRQSRIINGVRDECTICYHYRIIISVGCGNGHRLCRICMSKVDTCPFCRKKL